MAYELPQKPLCSAVLIIRILHRWVKYQGNKSFIFLSMTYTLTMQTRTHYTSSQWQQRTLVWYTTLPDMIYFTHSTWYVLWYIRRDLKSIIFQDEINFDCIHWGICWYTWCRQNINSCKLVPEGAHCHLVLVSQLGGFLCVNFVYSRILIL